MSRGSRDPARRAGIADLVLDYCHAVRVGLPALAGQLGAAYAIPVIYVPLPGTTHVVAFHPLLRPRAEAMRPAIGDAATS